MTMTLTAPPNPAATAKLKDALRSLGQPSLGSDQTLKEAIESALRDGADPNFQDDPSGQGLSAVGLALWHEAPWAVEALLQAGANPNLPPSGEFNPLRLALRASPKSALLLLDHGACPRDLPGETRGPLDRAAQHGRCEAFRKMIALRQASPNPEPEGFKARMAARAAQCEQLEMLALILAELPGDLPSAQERSRAMDSLDPDWLPYFNALFDAAEACPGARSIPELLDASARLGAHLPTLLMNGWLEDLRRLDEEMEMWEPNDSPLTDWMGFALRQSPDFGLSDQSAREALSRMASLREDPAAALALAEALALSSTRAQEAPSPAQSPRL